METSADKTKTGAEFSKKRNQTRILCGEDEHLNGKMVKVVSAMLIAETCTTVILKNIISFQLGRRV